MINSIQNFVNSFGTRISKKDLANKVTAYLTYNGIEACTLNEKYVSVGDHSYQFIKKSSAWVVKEF